MLATRSASALQSAAAQGARRDSLSRAEGHGGDGKCWRGGNPFFPLHDAASDTLRVVAARRGCSTAGKNQSVLWDWESELKC